MESKLNSVVIYIIKLSDTSHIIRVKPLGWELPTFTPGQFVVLGLYGDFPRIPDADTEDPKNEADKLIRRAYSIASHSTSDYVEFYITLMKSGALTPRLFNLKVGDKIFMSNKPTGMFTLEKIEEEKNVVLIATGTGVAPYMSMLRTDALHRKGKIVVIQGSAHSWEMAYFSELKMLEKMYPNFHYFPVISRPKDEPIEWTGVIGYVQDVWKNKEYFDKIECHPSPENTCVFLCGNPNMIKSMKDVLMPLGYTEHSSKNPGEIYAEEF